MEPAPNPQWWGGSKKLEGGSLKFVTPAPQHEGKWLNLKQNIHQHKDKSCNLKKHKKTHGPTGLYNCFFTCAYWRGYTFTIYKTVLIIFPLSLQTITITLDIVKWRWGGGRCQEFSDTILKHFPLAKRPIFLPSMPLPSTPYGQFSPIAITAKMLLIIIPSTSRISYSTKISQQIHIP